MEELKFGFWLSLLMLPFGGAGTSPQTSTNTAPPVSTSYLHFALENADTEQVTYAVEEGYAAAGVSRNDTLTWQFQPYDGIVNWYNQHSQVINLSALPGDDEVAPYWDNWSKTLTAGNWDWRAFFADDAEARTMARFNQFVLAAHEYGHALTYRYDPEHEAREGNEVNCRELPADRLAAGLLEEMAGVDPLIAGYRQRYAELVAAINAAIAQDIRYAVIDYARLDADCHLMHVAQPDETTMAPYASAYFARWQALLETDLPPLAQLYETYLYAPLRARLSQSSDEASWVTTVDWIDDDIAGNFEHGAITGWRLPAFAPDGRLYVMSYAVTPGDGDVGLFVSYGPAGSKKKTVIDSAALGARVADPQFFDLTAFLPLGPDRFLAASSDLWGDEASVVVLDVERGPEGWTHRMAQPLPGVVPSETRLRMDADGVVRLDIYQFGHGDAPARWLSYRLDADRLETGAMTDLPDSPYVRFSDLPDGAGLLIDQQNPSVLLERDGPALRIAGNGLQGYKELGDPLEIEFISPSAAIGMDGRIRVLDYEPYLEQYVVREIEIER
ncbi:hypothetical protein [Devosia sp. 63-57]|uniref:hypothetical protein n=1 Tax=Devosia sp. 63-57 TaxID=1895751 RepID=UPI000869CB3C|nr:hypothetical protein [Devosia sp. 63-57]ODU85447.1 MAG: hypothetical protein ABT14_12665 [Pelagibacterium sp. SCN 63-17]